MDLQKSFEAQQRERDEPPCHLDVTGDPLEAFTTPKLRAAATRQRQMDERLGERPVEPQRTVESWRPTSREEHNQRHLEIVQKLMREQKRGRDRRHTEVEDEHVPRLFTTLNTMQE